MAAPNVRRSLRLQASREAAADQRHPASTQPTEPSDEARKVKLAFRAKASMIDETGENDDSEEGVDSSRNQDNVPTGRGESSAELDEQEEASASDLEEVTSHRRRRNRRVESSQPSVTSELSAFGAATQAASRPRSRPRIIRGKLVVPGRARQYRPGSDSPANPSSVRSDDDESDDLRDEVSIVSTVDGDAASEDALFVRRNGKPLRMWVHPDCHNAAALKENILRNGGECVEGKSAHFWLLDSRAESYDAAYAYAERLSGPTVALLQHWVSDCIAKRRRLPTKNYRPFKTWAWRHHTSARATRTAFTQEDEMHLVRDLRAYYRRCQQLGATAYLTGNAVYERIAMERGRHPAESWRNHYKRRAELYEPVIVGKKKIGDLFGGQRSQARTISIQSPQRYRKSSSAAMSSQQRRPPYSTQQESPYTQEVEENDSLWPDDEEDVVMPPPFDPNVPSAPQGNHRYISTTVTKGPVASTSVPLQTTTQTHKNGPKAQSSRPPPLPTTAKPSQMTARQNPEAAQLANELEGALNLTEAADLIYCCQSLRIARAFAHHTFPPGYISVLDTPIAFAARVDNFLRSHTEVWTPEEDLLAVGRNGALDERTALAARKAGAVIGMKERMEFLVKQDMGQVGQLRFPFDAHRSELAGTPLYPSRQPRA